MTSLDKNNSFQKKQVSFLMALIIISTCFTYYPVVNAEFLNWDDPQHLTENPLVRSLSWSNLVNIFQSTQFDTYNPLTILSFAIEYAFFGYNATVFHITNLALHIFITLYLFRLILRFGFSLFVAWVAAFLFAIHPMHVESVAWITERKDVLYSFFYVLSIGAYWTFLSERKGSAFVVSVFWGILSMLSKPMALSLPLLLILCDYLFEKKITKRHLWTKVPYFLYIIPITWITYSNFARNPIGNVGESILTWIWTSSFYPIKFFLPFKLVPIYEFPEPVTLLSETYVVSVFVFIGFVFSLFKWKRSPVILFCLLFHFLSMFFLFRFDTGKDTHVVADRFMYLPSVGFCILIALGVQFMYKKMAEKSEHHKRICCAFFVLLAFALCIKSNNQVRIWDNSFILWNNVIQHNPKLAMAYNNRGNLHTSLTLALSDYNRTLELDPEFLEAYFNRGGVYYDLKLYDQAISDYNTFLKFDRYDAEVYYRRYLCYKAKGEIDLAEKDKKVALQLGFSVP